ncbi:2-polyprenyl-3-methyl-6-methoxy-1,4-benzoquinone monooxygenase [Psychrobacter celer]|uniref:2-polyprenyl-3-methyl-6-methoxy-1,4-benzoquinone monooxygenase n=1 Tax=Psychrobacter TaxID=497 RepID=UPI0009469B83|nr:MULTISPECIES: 2-polyprenyl-3-methyl-6-methoxy-1,4-benzoquinone monooxygenase [unclassified Psychrobacter]MDN5732709.1 2-polyprenyl-3-methyl-6-methoxy-1,4-benzoquinone monooxygenase [Psychrobacter sp.]OLF42027.1 demethoxyubiquinone hydroxylase family protein [Psychrobacter sp. Rd 27.2]PJX21203.1 demethoxyubiquinone hydroxylase family protein [Psychrobacter sp. L7]
MAPRPLSKVDQLLVGVDKALRAVVPHSNPSTRPLPVSSDEIPELSITEARHVAGLMRINHTGEVCAQGLYHGQAFSAKDDGVKQAMQQSAEEEVDHLVWCETRLDELGSHASIFTPLWYGMSFSLGAVAGAISNEFSLGFVAETEAQVSEHLQDHITQLPEQDQRSKEILAQMDIEELHHRELALANGGATLSPAVRQTMRWMANRMKATAYHL